MCSDWDIPVPCLTIKGNGTIDEYEWQHRRSDEHAKPADFSWIGIGTDSRRQERSARYSHQCFDGSKQRERHPAKPYLVAYRKPEHVDANSVNAADPCSQVTPSCKCGVTYYCGGITALRGRFYVANGSIGKKYNTILTLVSCRVCKSGVTIKESSETKTDRNV
mgnify:CR=1 FL=1